jgi:hypothetical protein
VLACKWLACWHLVQHLQQVTLLLWVLQAEMHLHRKGTGICILLGLLAACAAGGGSCLKGLRVPELQRYLRANGQR